MLEVGDSTTEFDTERRKGRSRETQQEMKKEKRPFGERRS